DTVSTGQLTSININILNNDTGLEDAPLTVSIIQSPSYGTASIDPDNSITYNPDGVFSGVVTIIYSVTDMDGDITIATITVNISCATCASGYNLTYEWSPNLAGDSVIGYRIYTGSTIGTANTEISNTLVSSNGFTASAPSISYDAWNDLALKKGDTVCFRVKAYNEAGLSGFSTGICDVIPN
ncbi:MAG: cadherin-like domain-containing protein, partial [Ectothiorhodospiraceae bacterium]|nr:cadherin-like domain-containing protein [Ectothiorhodospiraceae bacterium]